MFCFHLVDSMFFKTYSMFYKIKKYTKQTEKSSPVLFCVWGKGKGPFGNNKQNIIFVWKMFLKFY